MIGLGAIFLVQTKILPVLRDLLSEPAEAKRDLLEFAQSYRNHPAYGVSSLVASAFAIISSLTGSVAAGGLAMAAIFAPAIWFYRQNSPFGLRCNYIPVGRDSEHDCSPREGTYTVQLEMNPGDDIDDYRLDVHTPSGAKLDRIDGNTSHLDEERQILYGFVDGDGGVESYTEALYIEKTGSISPDGELVLIKSQGDDYTMEWIQLLPP